VVCLRYYQHVCRSQWPRGLRRSSAAAGLLRFWVRITPEAWMFGCCECCVLSGRGLCDKLITRPEVCNLENLVNEDALVHWGLSRQKQKLTCVLFECLSGSREEKSRESQRPEAETQNPFNMKHRCCTLSSRYTNFVSNTPPPVEVLLPCPKT
jgi:hypothetical protein